MQDDYAYSEPSGIVNSSFKHLQGYLGIFRDIDAHSATLTGAQLGRRGEASRTLFENRKKCPDFGGKKGPDCIHLWVKITIQNIVLRISRGKNSKMFPCRASFSCVFDEMFICLSKCPSFTTPLPSSLPALKNFWLRTCSQTFFLQNAPS